MINLLSIKDSDFYPELYAALAKFQVNMPVILFIEPYGAVLSLLRHGLDCGFNIVVLTANSDLRIVPDSIINSVALSIQINTADTHDVMGLISNIRKSIQFDAVIPGFEYFVPLAAKIAKWLGLPGVDVNNVELLRNKYLMRIQLQAKGLKVPQFELCYSFEELEAALNLLGFPAICKPIDAAGSVNVCKVTSIHEARLAAINILDKENVLWGYLLSRALLVEEYIAGKEYSVEGVVCQGVVTYFSITEKFVADEIEFIEIGHIVNPELDGQIKIRIIDYINQVITVLKPNNCPFHAELRITKAGEPVLMEMAARLAGDKIGDLINLSCDVNYFDAVYASYLGLYKSLQLSLHSSAGIRFFYRPYTGEYSSLRGLEDIRALNPQDLRIYYGPNQFIPSFPKPLRRLGHVILADANYSRLVESLEFCDQAISFQ